ncbi:MAG: FHA domain-containing protein [bacterium]
MADQVSVTIGVYRDDQFVSRHVMKMATFKIGRMGFSDLVLDDPGVSLTHARVGVRTDGFVYIRSAGSGSDVWVRGARIKDEVSWNPMEAIRLGPFSLILEATPGAAAAASAVLPKCEACGFEPPPGSKFCNQCGTKL